MSQLHDPGYDLLFEPIRIGPVTARNRFFQVPHCNGMGYRDPSAVAAMRGMKAEGGWAVVATEETEIHHSSETTPYIEGRIWANLWGPDVIVVIDPDSGHMTHRINLHDLLPPEDEPGTDVLNGIAFDAAERRVFVTGKLWPKLFEIELLPDDR